MREMELKLAAANGGRDGSQETPSDIEGETKEELKDLNIKLKDSLKSIIVSC